MNKKFELIFLVSGFCLSLVSFNLTFGLAFSLGELGNETEAENASNSNMSNYRIKLIDYMKSHNLTAFFPSNISQLDEVHTSTLEQIVKSHKEQCESGTSDESIASIKNNTMLDLAGDC